uniref:Uncharacterized protein n=1 Tax=Anguilla anguilla TaxID=7936 RepID=A0A0E9UXE2_ANGAN
MGFRKKHLHLKLFCVRNASPEYC